MGKVYIRSQDRGKLVLFDEVIGYLYYSFYTKNYFEEDEKIEEIDAHHAIVAVAAGHDVKIYLGFYESKERCLEILDEIQHECESYYKSTCSLNIPDMLFDMPKVYQMPEK